MEKLYVIIPAYNEGMNIEQCIDDWYPIVERHNGNGESRLVIINDGSKDNTYEIMGIRYCMVIDMQSDMMQIIFFRQIPTDKQIRQSLKSSGKQGKSMMQ